MRKIVPTSTVLLVSALLVGCATNPSDCNVHDRNASMLKKMSCMDAYQATEANAKNELELAREENAAFRRVYEDLKAEQAAVGKSLKEQQKAHLQTQASLSAMLKKVKARQGNKADAQKQIAELEKQLQAQSQLPNAASQAELKKRQEQRDELRRKVQQLELSLGY